MKYHKFYTLGANILTYHMSSTAYKTLLTIMCSRLNCSFLVQSIIRSGPPKLKVSVIRNILSSIVVWRNTFSNKINLGSDLASVRCPTSLLELVSCHADVSLANSQIRVGEHGVHVAYYTECVQTLPVGTARQVDIMQFVLVRTQTDNQLAQTASAFCTERSRWCGTAASNGMNPAFTVVAAYASIKRVQRREIHDSRENVVP